MSVHTVLNAAPVVIGSAIDITSSMSSAASGIEITKQFLGAASAVGEAVKPFLPLISAVTLVISEIVDIYETAQYNKKICNSLMDRVTAAEAAVKTLQRRKSENEKNFRNLEYYKAFVRFVDVMKKIQIFIGNVSQLQGYKKFMHASSVKEKFTSITDEFDTVMSDLHFTMAVANEEQRKLDQESLTSDIAEMTKFLGRIEGGIIDNNNKINIVLQEVLIMKDKVEHMNSAQNDPSIWNMKANEIKPVELTDPLNGRSTDRRGEAPCILKKIYKVQEVACKPINIPETDSPDAKKIQGHLAILGKLRDSPNILRFYGLSYVDNNQVMVLEWAEMGSLKEVYDKYDIAWHAKVLIALDICRGLTFLHSCDILHHDVRCQNIMMTARMEPKISNFNYSRMSHGPTSDMKHITDVVHWMAPEKLQHTREKPVSYNFKCEIFSFGMLLWELAFEKVPYEKWDMIKIKEHVLSGKREKISWGKASPDIQKLQKDYAKIIDDPQIRISLQGIFMALDKLADEHCKVGTTSPSLFPDKKLDLDGTSQEPVPISISDDGGMELPDMDMDFSIDSIPTLLSLEEGIAAHKRKEINVAWECFVAHSDLGNKTAKYWQGYYLWEGYVVEKDRKRASELFKEAADDGIADAQLRYAFSLVNNPSIKFDRQLFLEYLTKAADNNNPTAQFNLGDLYLNGKLKIQVDLEKGKKYLRLAAHNNQPKAKEALEKMGINIYVDTD
ncbi:995_t:CDS:2 [Acaulospora morrowiae]|uniref:995_t:CDS:1 n=1 Tax=Acaulospora morrowiae TaxID=94023 RepID=A0A9N9E3I0_9GLOM|nr:995_t:CDS:2 [Acaulospora morrowiae]